MKKPKSNDPNQINLFDEKMINLADDHLDYKDLTTVIDNFEGINREVEIKLDIDPKEQKIEESIQKEIDVIENAKTPLQKLIKAHKLAEKHKFLGSAQTILNNLKVYAKTKDVDYEAFEIVDLIDSLNDDLKKEYYIENFIEKNSLVLLVAKAKVGKSAMMNNMEYHLLKQGQDNCGNLFNYEKFKCNPIRNIAHYNGDEQNRDTLPRLLEMGLTKSDMKERIYILRELDLYSDEKKDFKKLTKFKNDYGIDILFGDVLSTIILKHEIDLSNKEDMKYFEPFWRNLADYVTEEKLTIIMGHHEVKSGKDKRSSSNSIDSIAGCSEITRPVHQIIKLEKISNGYLKLISDGSRNKNLVFEAITLQWNDNYHLKIIEEIETVGIDKPKPKEQKDAKRQEIKDLIVIALNEEGIMTKQQIHEYLNKNYGNIAIDIAKVTFYRYIDDLKEEGILKTVGKKGNAELFEAILDEKQTNLNTDEAQLAF